MPLPTHAEAEAEPAGDVVPVEHAVHMEEPAAAQVFTLHSAQEPEVRKLPPTHDEHVVCEQEPEAHQLPHALQATTDVDPAGEEVFVGQDVHVVTPPPVEYVLARHSVQTPDVSLAPPMQEVHVEPEQ